MSDMGDALTLRRLRALLRALAAAIFASTVAELLLAEHTNGWVQLVPFVLCGLGLLALAALSLWPGRATRRVLRLTMALIVCGSLVGVAEHAWGNYAFARETHPGAGAGSLIKPTLTGADPLLAPGILAVAAALSLAATFAAGSSEHAATPRVDADVAGQRLRR